jgi:enamine deaminase RidA (YjgF/YER057c/UK114 family)
VGLGLLASAREALGSLDRIKRIVKVLGMVNSADGFVQQPQVMNGFSDLMVEVFGDAGRHARSAVGMGSLPFATAVEIEMIREVSGAARRAPATRGRASGRRAQGRRGAAGRRR